MNPKEKRKKIVYKEDREIGEHFTYDPKTIIPSLKPDCWSIIFEGKTKKGLPIAVKRTQLVDINTKNIQQFVDDCIERNLDHPNVLKYIHCEINEDFL